MTMIDTFKNTGRAAVVALALGATAFAAVPAQAAPSSSFSLSLNGGNGSGITFGTGNGHGSVQLHFGNGNYGYKCYTNNQVEKALGKYGFRQADVVKKLKGDRVLVVAKHQGTWYEMRVDKCSGKVDKVKKLKWKNNNNFNFTITF
jgi:hypothetical protein